MVVVVGAAGAGELLGTTPGAGGKTGAATGEAAAIGWGGGGLDRPTGTTAGDDKAEFDGSRGAGAGGGGVEKLIEATAGVAGGNVIGLISGGTTASREPGRATNGAEIGDPDDGVGASAGAVSIASRQNKAWHR